MVVLPSLLLLQESPLTQTEKTLDVLNINTQ